MQNTTWSIDVLPQPQLSDVEVQEMGGKQKQDAKNKRCTVGIESHWQGLQI